MLPVDPRIAMRFMDRNMVLEYGLWALGFGLWAFDARDCGKPFWGTDSRLRTKGRSHFKTAYVALNGLCHYLSFAPSVLALSPFLTHGLRRGLHSYATPRLS